MRFRSVFAPSWHFSSLLHYPFIFFPFSREIIRLSVHCGFLPILYEEQSLPVHAKYLSSLLSPFVSQLCLLQTRRLNSYIRWDGTGRIYGVSKYIGQAVRQTSAMRDIALYSKLRNQRNLIVPRWKFSRVFIKMIKFMSITIIFYKI